MDPRHPRRSHLLTLASIVILLSAAGCSTLALRDNSLIPTRHQIDIGPYVVHSNFPLPGDSPAVVELGRLRRQVEETLDIPIAAGTGSIEVFILDDSRAFAHFLNTYYHELPQRRAFFLAQGDRRVVYTFLGERLAEDLRHEATHALMHTIVADMPLWLDEGLAEYFEDAGSVPGDNPEHLSRLADELRRWKPDLAHLEQVQEVRDMSPRDYREAWAWVHYLVSQSPASRNLLSGYLRQLGSGGDPVPLSEQLTRYESDPSGALVAHIRDLLKRSALARLEQTHSYATVRLQSQAGTDRRERRKALGESVPVVSPERDERRGSALGDLTRGLLGIFRLGR